MNARQMLGLCGFLTFTSSCLEEATGPKDAGLSRDAAVADAGSAPSGDAGTPPADAGTGLGDAGTPPPGDAGTRDAGEPPGDAGAPVDAGEPPPLKGAPLVLYTDVLSGPNSGGENNLGIYLSIFGKNFGGSGLGDTVKVFINGVEPAVYRSLGPSRGRTDIDQITVQVGPLGNPVAGTALPIKVVVGGVASNTDVTFMVNPGRILFVDNVAGKDATAVIGDIGHPYRFVQTASLGGAWGAVKPGDFIVMRGGGSPWVDVGFEGYFMRYRDKSGTAPTGAANSGPITVMGYPGEDVFIRGLLANGMSGGCISAINGQTYPNAGRWAVITNLRIDCEGYDGPVSQEVYGDHWRVVNNDLAASTAPTSGPDVPRMAGITGNGQDAVWLGNHIHDIQGSSGECHGIYIDGDGSYEIAYNRIHDVRSGNGFQIYVNGGNGSDTCSNVSFHHNVIHDVSKHGINVADGSKNNIVVYDNVVFNVAYAGLRFNTTDLKGGKFFNNTFYNVVVSGNENYGAITNDWNFGSGALDVENNIFWPHAGSAYNGGSNGVPASAGTIRNNLWFGATSDTSLDSAPVPPKNPNFVNAAAGDFHLTDGGAVDTGSNGVSAVVKTDFDLTQGRPQRGGFDVGAYEL